MRIGYPAAMMVCCAVGISGCTTGGVGAVGSPMWQMTASKDEKINTFVATCVSYGFKQDTKEMAQCIASESRAARESAARSLDTVNRNNAIRNSNARRTSTTCTGFGNTLNCHTY